MKAEYIAPTPAEVNEIKHGNRETINRVYTADYPLILTICKAYCRNAEIKNDLWEDMAHECYLYFNKFNFSSVGLFITSVREYCKYVRWGGQNVYLQAYYGNTEILTILDEPLKGKLGKGDKDDNARTLGEIVLVEFNVIDEIEPPPDYTEIVHDIAVEYLSPREREIFDYFYYTDITHKDVSLILGVSVGCIAKLKSRYINKLRKHAEELRQELLLIGLQSSSLRQTATA